jgi:hypothetical protein
MNMNTRQQKPIVFTSREFGIIGVELGNQCLLVPCGGDFTQRKRREVIAYFDKIRKQTADPTQVPEGPSFKRLILQALGAGRIRTSRLLTKQTKEALIGALPGHTAQPSRRHRR